MKQSMKAVGEKTGRDKGVERVRTVGISRSAGTRRIVLRGGRSKRGVFDLNVEKAMLLDVVLNAVQQHRWDAKQGRTGKREHVWNK